MIITELTEDRIREIMREELNRAFPSTEAPLTMTEVAKMLGKTTRTIANWVKLGLIKPINHYGHPKFSLSDVKKLKEQKYLNRKP